MNVLERQAQVKKRLNGLPLPARVAFGAACAQRLAPVCAVYCARSDDENLFAEMLERVWAWLAGSRQSDEDELAQMYEDAAEALPPEDSLSPKAQAVVEYACTSSASTLGQLIGTEPEGSADAALCVWEAIVCSAEGSSKTARLREELIRQDEALEALRAWPELGEPERRELATDIRERAESDALTYLLSVL